MDLYTTFNITISLGISLLWLFHNMHYTALDMCFALYQNKSLHIISKLCSFPFYIPATTIDTDFSSKVTINRLVVPWRVVNSI